MTFSFNALISLLATWFGCGRLPRAPGTFGTLGAMPLVWFLAQMGEMQYLIATVAFCAVGIWVAQLYEDVIAMKHDTPEFVLDEVAGFLITMALVPLSWVTLLAGFVAFRFFDVMKPWPISWIDQKVPGGAGAMADDIVAGIAASLVLQVALHYGVLP